MHSLLHHFANAFCPLPLLALTLLSQPASALAQAVPVPPDPLPGTEPEAGQAALQPPPQEKLDLPEAHHSLQKLLALPDWVQIQVQTIAQPFVNPIGGLTPSAAWMQQTSLLGSIGTGLSKPEEEWQEIDHWTVDLQLSLLNGNPNYGAKIGAVYSPQALSDPVGFWPTLLTLSRRPGKDGWGIEAGILPFEPDFLTAPISGLYVSTLLATAPGIRIPSSPSRQHPHSEVC